MEDEAKVENLQSDNLKLILPNGDGLKFFVRSMVLDEGLGIIPTARLELCSSTPGSVMKMDELKGCLGSSATVEFKHINVAGGAASVVSTRWMSGQVVAVEHLGVIHMQNKRKPVCGYRMTVRPSLAKLCLRRSRYQFANTAATDVLTTLLDSCCKGEYEFSPSAKTGEPPWSKARDFSQGEETDYEFFVRVLASCGLTYHFQMKKPGKANEGAGDLAPVAPTLHVVDAIPNKANQLSAIEIEKAKPGVTPDDVSLSYKDTLEHADGKSAAVKEIAAKCIGRMTAWEMSQSVGVEGCSVSFGDASGARISFSDNAASGKNAVRMNHVPFDNIRSADEVKDEIGVFLKSLRRNDGIWLGVTSRLEARVGAALKLYGYYGTMDESSCIRDLVIVRTRVRLESRIPTGLLAPQGGHGWRQYVSVGCISTASGAVTDFSALPTGRLGETETFGGDRASGDFSHVEKVVPASQGSGGGSKIQVNVEEDWRNAAGAADAWLPTTMLVQATVCTSDGNVGDASKVAKNDTSALRTRLDGKTCYEFYATPDGADADKKVMVVRYVQPVGGQGQGLFRVPRIGDRILVARCSPSGASVGGINYLMGYLPGVDMPHVTSWGGDHAKQMDALTLRFDQTETMKKDLCKDKGTAGNEINEYGKLTATERFDGAPCFRRGRKQNTFSELGFYDDHKSAIRERADSKKLEFADGDPRQRGALANLQSTGDVQVSANDRVEVNGRNIHLGCPGWGAWRDGKTQDGKVEVDDVNELVVRANRRIVLNVGGSSIVIDKDGIALDSNRWREAQGIPFTTASVVVSGMQGVAIGGQEVSISGEIGASIGDAAGGAFVANAGTSSITGSIIRSRTQTAAGAGVRLAVLLGRCLMPLKGLVMKDDDPTVEGKCMPLGTFFGNCAELHFLRKYNATSGDSCPGALKAIAALRLIGSIIDISRMGVRTAVGQEAWEKEPSEEMSVGDIMFIMSLLFKFTAWMTAWIAITADNAFSGMSSTITLRTMSLDFNTPEERAYFIRRRNGNGPMAGIDPKDGAAKFAELSQAMNL